MAFKDSVSVNVSQATASAEITNLNAAMLFDVNTYHQARVTPYYSMDDVRNDTAVPVDSPLYKALQNAFPNAKSRSLPIYVGRIQPDETVLTPEVQDSTNYSFKVRVVDTSTGLESVAATEIAFVSDSDATLAEIVTGLADAVTTAAILPTDLLVVDNGLTLSLAPAADRQIIVTDVTENIKQTFVYTESAATAFSEVSAENPDEWYFVCTTVRDIPWILDLADVVKSTLGSDLPKMMRVSSKSLSTLVAQTDPSAADDLLGLLEDNEYQNVFGEWHHLADEIYPELASVVYNGGFFVGTQSWAFMNNCTNPVARHPTLGRKLTKAEAGFIMDRNAAVRFQEMGLTVYKVGTSGDVARGQAGWADNLQISDWARLTMKQRVFNSIVNAGNAGKPLTFTAADRAVIKERCESVLTEGVSRKMFSGFDPVVVPSTISFEDQAERTLKDVSFTAYFAGKVYYVIIDGVLTYREEV